MRPLTDAEKKIVFEKLAKFIGVNIKRLIAKGTDDKDTYVFRLHHGRVYYLSVFALNYSSNFQRKTLFMPGTMIGKFTKTGNFRLTIQSLEILAKYAQNKVWVKSNSEMSFLYGLFLFILIANDIIFAKIAIR